MPKILVTNDDGIAAAGIRALERALAKIGEVYTVAPAREMSAASHSISLRRPVSFQQVKPRRWAVDGTPADAVILAVHRLLGFRPDLLVSGINSGGNLGRNVYYSGTVSAAVEGTLHHIPSMAVSACGPPFDFSRAAGFGACLAARMIEEGLPDGVTLNVNVPGAWRNGARLTRLGRSEADSLLSQPGGPASGCVQPEESDSPADHRLTSHGAAWRPVLTPDSDYAAVEQGSASVTPLLLDRTDGRHMEALARWLEALPATPQ